MNLLLLEDGDFIAADRVLLQGRRLKHLQEVHRAEVGDSLRVGRLGGLMGQGQLLRLDSDAAELQISLEQSAPAKLPLTLLLALPRPKMLKRVLQTVASMGVPRLILLNSYRVEKSFWQTPFLQPEAIREQLILGLEQARDTVLPEVIIEKRFKLRTPIYSETASYGHMGRESKVVEKVFKSAGKEKKVKVKLFPWEDLNALSVVKKAFKL